jgi:membrane-bound lytic murein transglycosylase D
LTVIHNPKEIQALTQKDCSTNFPCPEELIPKIQFWIRTFQEFDQFHAIFHDAEYPEVVYSIVKSDYSCASSRAIGPVDQERKRIRTQLRSILAKSKETNASYTDEENALLLQTKKAVNFDLEKAAERVRCQNGIRDQFEQALARYHYYKDDIVQILKTANLPEEIQYLPFVESSYNPLAYSRVGAAGLWQIMPQTARLLGLKINASIDERMDPILATMAAAQYFNNSYENLGKAAVSRGYDLKDNFLGPFVITSYNYGVGGMVNALSIHGVDFMSTLNNYKGRAFRVAVKNFYASFLAAKHIVTHQKDYFPNIDLYKFPEHKLINVPQSMSAIKFAESFNVPIESLRELNPVLTKRVWSGVQPIPQAFPLKVPINFSEEDVRKKLLTIPADQLAVKVKSYRVERGDTPCSIARMFNASCAELLAMNGLTERRNTIRVGQNITIPTKDVKEPKAKNTPPAAVASKSPVSPTQSILIMDEKPQQQPDIVVPMPEPPVAMIKEAPTEKVPAPAPIEGVIKLPPPTEKHMETPPAPAPVMAATDAAVNTSLWLVEKTGEGSEAKYSIHVEPEETLGHYSDWIGSNVVTQTIREINNIPFSKNLTLGQKIILPFQNDEQKTAFEQKRADYHQTIEEGFQERYTIIAITTYQIKKGDSEWSISNDLQVPMWLLKKYNPTLLVKALKVGEALTVPLLKDKTPVS